MVFPKLILTPDLPSLPKMAQKSWMKHMQTARPFQNYFHQLCNYYVLPIRLHSDLKYLSYYYNMAENTNLNQGINFVSLTKSQIPTVHMYIY